MTVAIVDDHLLVAESLQAALRGRGVDARVIAPSELATLSADLLAASADLILLDLDLGGFGDSTAIIATLVQGGSKVLTVTGVVDRLRIAAALEAGALDYQPKSAGFDALLDATCAALAASGPMHPQQRAQLLAELDVARKQRAVSQEVFLRLTARESDTLQALATGLSVRDIADEWVVSEATVRTHVRSVLNKLGTKSQLAAVAMAARHGWARNAVSR
jgi:two-component system nitrate/nitrite response regulator NarL